MNIKWKTGPPPTSPDPILAQVDFVSGEPVTLLCIIDKDGDVIDWPGGNVGDWDSTAIDRWILLSEILGMLDGSSRADLKTKLSKAWEENNRLQDEVDRLKKENQ